MDPQRFKETYERLQYLDERLTYKIRRRERAGLHSPNLDQLDEAMKDMGDYMVELKEILRELFLAIGSKPKGGQSGQSGQGGG